MKFTLPVCCIIFGFLFSSCNFEKKNGVSLATTTSNLESTGGNSGNSIVDMTPPSTPTGLHISSLTSVSFVLNWQPSFDSSAPIRYGIYLDNILIHSTENLFQLITNLIPQTQYRLHVQAMDAAGNRSTLSSEYVVSTQANQGQTGFHMQNGVIVVDLAPPGVVTSARWQRRTDFTPFSGNDYLLFTGANAFANPDLSGGIDMVIPFWVQEAGIYQLNFRSRISTGNDRTEHNDVWVRIPTSANAPGEYSVGGNTFRKVFQNDLNAFSWQARPNDHDYRDTYRVYLTAGRHEIHFHGRSTGFILDRFVLHNIARNLVPEFWQSDNLEPLPLTPYTP